MTSPSARAVFKTHDATDLIEVTDDLGALDRGGWWAVLLPFDGPPLAARFGTVRATGSSASAARTAQAAAAARWRGPERDTWTSSATRESYIAGVEEIRSTIAAGGVYQVNLCRVLRAPDPNAPDPQALAGVLASANPSPFAGYLHIPELDVAVVSASPELFLRRDGLRVTSSPVKGTAAPGEPFAPKDQAENVMIVDLVRNDLGVVAATGSVEVDRLCVREEHPGLAHLVSTVSATLRADVQWTDLIAATFPPGSVSGAPKSAALRVIDELESDPRGPYCGAFGWIDADRGVAELAVSIRTFWWQDGSLCLGTGAGITWGSDAAAEWSETELKAAKLLAAASRSTS